MKAHSHDFFAERVELCWKKRPSGRWLHCSYCGSVNPAELAAQIRKEGVTLDKADQKYGWPHKFYISGSTDSDFWKFYTEHLKDAIPPDLDTLHKAMRLVFTFEPNGQVSWRPYQFQQ